MLRIRKLDIRITTNKQPFGVTIPFENGLNIIHADNTSGKSTCVMSILYAMGLEGMLGPSQDPPLTAAMLQSLTYRGQQFRVLQSEILLEIEGRNNSVVTLQRQVTGALKERQLVVVHEGDAISRPQEPFKRTSYFVRTSGGAHSESGFHRFFAKFLGLDLPELTDFEGETRPLYLECFFPFFFVEQLTGWRDIKARMPTYLQVPEMAKRSAEFVMKLDILYRALRRQELRQRAKQLTAAWQNARDQSLFGSYGLGFVVRGIPEQPVEVWPPPHPPNLYVADELRWLTIDNVIAQQTKELRRLTEEEIPQAQFVTAEAKTAIANLEVELRDVEHEYRQLFAAVSADEEQLRAIRERLSSLKEDRRKYQDEQMLRTRGASDEFDVHLDHCPVCDRPLKDVLLPQINLVNPMSLEENIAFLRDQVNTFEFMETDALAVLEAKQEMLKTARESLFDITSQIRALNETLRSDGRLPSVAAIRKRLQLDALLERLTALKTAFDERLRSFEKLSLEWKAVQSELKDLKDTQLSPSDNRKLMFLEQSFKEQLREYGFSSFPLDDVGISRESYRPSHNGYDLGFTSASDTIRAIWAYLLGLLEQARSFDTNHIGLVVFDEPKQQSARLLSFGALLRRAAGSIKHGQQVIFATSEEAPTLETLLADIREPLSRLWFDEKMLRPRPIPHR